ncbi:hypothetical protein Lal_00027763 [Lupinus albus]|nr:hypothetical protein Lal_00027763 [Lupinus albus]
MLINKHNNYNIIFSPSLSPKSPIFFSQTLNPLSPSEKSQPFASLPYYPFDADDAGSVVLYAGGAVSALWLTSVVIGAIDSIPLFPKLLEVVGLGYTVWFTSRYLIFKKNRNELIAKIEELKEQVLGSED